MRHSIRTVIAAFVLAGLVGGCEDDPQPAGSPATETIVGVASSNSDFSTLVAAVKKAGLAGTLGDASKRYTVFAPTNAAFTALLTDLGITNGLDGLSAEQLRPILLYHVLGSEVRAAAATSAAAANQKIDSLGGKVQLGLAGSSIRLDDRASVVTADLLASNGVIHAIDRVILPSITDVVTTSDDFSSLKAAVLAADGDGSTTPKVAAALDGTSPFTLFAPSNGAFGALGTAPTGQALTDVLLYHAVPGAPVYAAAALGLTAPLVANTALAGKTVTLAAEGSPRGVTVADGTSTKANVTRTDLFTSNGVIHVVDKVLLP